MNIDLLKFVFLQLLGVFLMAIVPVSCIFLDAYTNKTIHVPCYDSQKNIILGEICESQTHSLLLGSISFISFMAGLAVSLYSTNFCGKELKK